MEKINEILESDGEFKEEKREELKNFFLKLTKSDLVAGVAAGVTAANLLTNPIAPLSTMDLFVRGGVTGAALILGINAVATGVKASLSTREKLRKEIEYSKLENEESKGKSI